MKYVILPILAIAAFAASGYASSVKFPMRQRHVTHQHVHHAKPVPRYAQNGRRLIMAVPGIAPGNGTGCRADYDRLPNSSLGNYLLRRVQEEGYLRKIRRAWH